ncbi:MAG: hypothetical protein ACE5NM_07525, partial [Sedimentisphaerales bacterium]
DASALEDAKIDQEIRVQNAYAAFINAQENLAVVQNQAVSDVNVAELTLEFARQDLDQYKSGQFPNEKTAAENEITLAREELTRAEETLKWSQKLYKEKYISESELQADKLAVTRSKNKLTLAENDLDLLTNFTYHRTIAQLESDVRQAEMSLERTKRKARADVIQAEADLKAKELEYKRQQDKLKKIEDQLAKAKIYAPADGMVIYATTARRSFRDSREPLDEGVEVFERQELIYLPTAESTMAEVDIHESSLEKVREGLPAIITVDALAGKKFLGRVGRIAPLPDARRMWMNPDLKVYNSEVYLEDNDSALRTGMSCKVEIIVAQYEDVVYVPIQAVLRVGGQPTVYCLQEKTFEPRKVEIGLDNNRMVHIVSGLDEGEVVLLTPPLKSGILERTIPVTAEPNAAGRTSESIDQRVRTRLEEVNGMARPQTADRTRQDSGPARQGRDIEPAVGQRPRPVGLSNLSSEEMQKLRQRIENMSPEQRRKAMEKIRRRFENTSPQQRQRMRQGQGSAPRGAGRRPRQSAPQKEQQ